MPRPTDIELARLLDDALTFWRAGRNLDMAEQVQEVADALREPPTVTEDMIERAARALRWEIGEGGGANAPITGKHLRIARTALTAALNPDKE